MDAVGKAPKALLSIDEFLKLPDLGCPRELVRGRVIDLRYPPPYHGWVCCNVAGLLGNHDRGHELGYIMGYSGVITERDPDTLRGADVAFYSYAKVPKASLERGRYLDVPPDLVIEVLSPDDRWPKVLAKVAEYLNAGVGVVGVLNPENRTLHLHEGDNPVRILNEDDELTLPALLGEFRVRVRQFFE